jgi:alkylhydroperoxidase family enzyme
VSFAQPTTKQERDAVAAQCCTALKMTIPLLVDSLDDRVGHAYSGMPDRLYLIDKYGRVAYKGGRGPFGFKPGELEQAIIMNLLEDGPIEKIGRADPWDRLPKAEQGRGQELPQWAEMLLPALPKTTAAMLELDYRHRVTSPLPAKLRAKMRWTAAHANRCAYTEQIALSDLGATGAPVEEIRALADSKTWPESERNALTFARKMTLEAYKVTDGEVAALRRQYGDANVVAMVQLLAYANFQDRLMHALGIEAPPATSVRGNPNWRQPIAVKFTHPFADAAPPAMRMMPASEGEALAVNVADPEWKKFDFATLQKLMDGQKARTPRIPVPSFDSVRKYMPPTFPKDKELKIKWSLVCMGYQPELASAWSQCTRSFGEESQQDRVFEESLFWVVTRSLQCFY